MIVDSDIFDNWIFSHEPFTKRLAYLWVLAFGPVRQDYGWLARKWQWTPSEVRKFIYRASGAGLFVIDGSRVSAVAVGDAAPIDDPRGWTMTRESVLARDGYTCVYCGSTDDLAADHVHPRSKGGADIPSNLVTACKRCNSSKRDRLLSEWTQKP